MKCKKMMVVILTIVFFVGGVGFGVHLLNKEAKAVTWHTIIVMNGGNPVAGQWVDMWILDDPGPPPAYNLHWDQTDALGEYRVDDEPHSSATEWLVWIDEAFLLDEFDLVLIGDNNVWVDYQTEGYTYTFQVGPAR